MPSSLGPVSLTLVYNRLSNPLNKRHSGFPLNCMRERRRGGGPGFPLKACGKDGEGVPRLLVSQPFAYCLPTACLLSQPLPAAFYYRHLHPEHPPSSFFLISNDSSVLPRPPNVQRSSKGNFWPMSYIAFMV